METELEEATRYDLTAKKTEITETSLQNNTASMASSNTTSIPTPTPVTTPEPFQSSFVHWITFVLILTFLVTALIWIVWSAWWKRRLGQYEQRKNEDVPLVLITPAGNGDVRLESAIVRGDRRAWESNTL
jgi:hypothetical protein